VGSGGGVGGGGGGGGGGKGAHTRICDHYACLVGVAPKER